MGILTGVLENKLRGLSREQARKLVLEWVAKGIITPDEAHEILDRIDGVFESGHNL